MSIMGHSLSVQIPVENRSRSGSIISHYEKEMSKTQKATKSYTSHSQHKNMNYQMNIYLPDCNISQKNDEKTQYYSTFMNGKSEKMNMFKRRKSGENLGKNKYEINFVFKKPTLFNVIMSPIQLTTKNTKINENPLNSHKNSTSKQCENKTEEKFVQNNNFIDNSQEKNISELNKEFEILDRENTHEKAEHVTGIPRPDKYNTHMITNYAKARRLICSHCRPRREKSLMDIPACNQTRNGFKGSWIKSPYYQSPGKNKQNQSQIQNSLIDKTHELSGTKIKMWEILQKNITKNHWTKRRVRNNLVNKIEKFTQLTHENSLSQTSKSYINIAFDPNAVEKQQNLEKITECINPRKRLIQKVFLPKDKKLEGNIFGESSENSRKMSMRNTMHKFSISGNPNILNIK